MRRLRKTGPIEDLTPSRARLIKRLAGYLSLIACVAYSTYVLVVRPLPALSDCSVASLSSGMRNAELSCSFATRMPARSPASNRRNKAIDAAGSTVDLAGGWVDGMIGRHVQVPGMNFCNSTVPAVKRDSHARKSAGSSRRGEISATIPV